MQSTTNAGTKQQKYTPFSERHSEDFRRAESFRILTKYPERVPVIVERHHSCYDIAEINNNKYLVPHDMTVGQFMCVVRKRIKLKPEQALFLFTETNQIPPQHDTLSNIYQTHRNADGFLYVTYNGENAFGDSTPFRIQGNFPRT